MSRGTRTSPAPKPAPKSKPKPTNKRAATRGDGTDAVAAFLRELDHPRKPEIEAIRELVLGVSPAIREGIKWNAPSFRVADDFATLQLRATDRVRIILHTGAKPKPRAGGLEVADPTGLLEWLAPDRCLVTILDARDLRAKRAALQAILRQWLQHLG